MVRRGNAMPTAASSRLPGPLRLTSPRPFVGRSAEMAILDDLWAQAVRDGRRVALVQGEPGSGKTRLAREVAQRAAQAGAGVLYGGCEPSLSSPYQAFAEALEQLAERNPAVIAEVVRGPRGRELAQLLPHLAPEPPVAPYAITTEPGGGRHRLHVAVTQALAAYARTMPVVLVLDDLHWADAPTLLLLRHLSRTGADVPLLILATFREVEAESAPDLADTLADLRRHDGVVRVGLTALRPTEIAEYLESVAPAAGRDELAQLAGALAELTGGNAFLVSELAQHLADARVLGAVENATAPAGALDAVGVPQGVREVVGQRLVHLSPAAREVLELAAVSGRAIELAVLRAAARQTEESLVASLDEAAHSHMLEEVPGPRIAFRFRHELLRRAVADRLQPARRAVLHLRIAEALETLHGAADDRRVNDLAFHFTAAASLAGSDRAVRYGLRAADAAMRSFAYDDAAGRLQGVLDLGIADPVTRAQALCDLGSALHRAGRAPQALDHYAAAAAVARATGDGQLLATAALGFEDACWRPGIEDARAVALPAEAMDRMPGGDSALRVRLLASLSRALAIRGDHVAAARHWGEAVAMARRVGDRRSLAVTLYHAAFTRGSRSPAAIVASLTEACDLLTAPADIDLRQEVEMFRLGFVLETYDMEEFRRGMDAFLAAAERAGQPFYLNVVAHVLSTLALCDGRFDDAESLATQALETSRQLDEDASQIHGIQMFTLERERGRLARVAPVLRTVARGDRGAAWGPALAVLLAELGMRDEARRELQRLAADDFAGVPRRGLWLAGMIYLADACALTDATPLAPRLYAELQGLEGVNVVIGHGIACYGAADRFLGTLAAMSRDWDAAERHFEAALEQNTRLGSPTWLAHTCHQYAVALLRRGGDGDAARARELLRDALAVARRIGMATLAARIEDAKPRLDAEAPPDGLSDREVEVLRLVAGGLSNRDIGQALNISPYTAANHVRSILAKTRCANRTEAASYAHTHGLVES